MFGEGFVLVIELGIVQHGDQGVAEQLEHLKLRRRDGLVGGEEVEEAPEAAGGAEAVEEEPEGAQEEVAETEAVEDVDPQLGQSLDGGLVEGAHQANLEDSRGKERRSGGPGSQKIWE